jgi:hypothetical protein
MTMPFIVTSDPIANFVNYLQIVEGFSAQTLMYVQATPPAPLVVGQNLILGSQLTANQVATINSLIANPSLFGSWTPTPADYVSFLLNCYDDPQAVNYPVALIYVQAIAASAQQMTTAQLNALLSAAQTAVETAYPSQASAIIAKVKSYMTANNIPY